MQEYHADLLKKKKTIRRIDNMYVSSEIYKLCNCYCPKNSNFGFYFILEKYLCVCIDEGECLGHIFM